jgi:ATP-dependent exoDNAse (exonuclease V) alpha subunit
MTGRSTLQNEEIKRTTKDTDTVENNSQIRRKRDPSDALVMQKSGTRSIISMDMIWNSAKLF